MAVWHRFIRYFLTVSVCGTDALFLPQLHVTLFIANQLIKEIACNTVDLPLKHQALEHVSLLLLRLNPNIVLGCQPQWAS